MQRLLRRSRSLLITLILLLAFTPLSVLANEKKTNEINYVALGDSLAAGVLSDDSKGIGYVGLIKSDLEAKGYMVNVHNKGVSGATTVNVLEGLSGIPELANADIITVSAGANDILGALNPILKSGINLSDLTPEKIAELQQTAIAAAGAVGTAKNTTSNTITEAANSLNTQTAVSDVETAAFLAAGEIVSIIPQLTSEQLAILNSIQGHILNAKGSLIAAVTNVNAAKVAFDANAQGVAENLATTANNLSDVVQNLSSIVEKIGIIESVIPLPPAITNVKNKTNEAIQSINNANEKVEIAIEALKTYKEAIANAEEAQLTATKAIDAATKLAAIPGVIEEIGVNTGKILATIKSVNPTAKIYVMGYYNALPYLPPNVQVMTKQMLVGLNEAIKTPTTQLGATFIPVAHLFEGKHETYLPNPSNIHPSEAGYKALAGGFIGEMSKAFPFITKPDPKEKEIDLEEELVVNAGEQIRINGTDVTLLLPTDLPTGTKLTVTETNKEVLSKANTSNLKQFGDVLNFEFQYPTGFENYKGTFTLVMGYDADSPADVDIYYYNEAKNSWESQKGTNNKESQTITLDVPHFSNYGIFAKVDKTDPTPPKTEDPGAKGETPVPVAKDPSNGSKDNTKKVTKLGTLPNTATNTYNWMLFGASLIIAGVVIYFISRRKRLSLESE